MVKSLSLQNLGAEMQAQPFLQFLNFFEGHNEVRIFYRDSDTSLIDQFLTERNAIYS